MTDYDINFAFTLYERWREQFNYEGCVPHKSELLEFYHLHIKYPDVWEKFVLDSRSQQKYLSHQKPFNGL